jgi:hypothetical protein
MHFLDTSILRHKIHGSSKYKQYLSEQIGDKDVYVSKYVKMEFNRSFLCNLINFYFTLHMPCYKTVSDAVAVWSDRFKSSELKAIIQFIAIYLSTHNLDLNDIKEKNKSLRLIESYIKRIALTTQGHFKDIGTNSARCGLADIELGTSDEMTAYDDIQKFKENFDNKSKHGNECNVAKFLMVKFKSQVKKYIDSADKISSPSSSKNRGFVNIANSLKLIQDGKEGCSCKVCEKIGDVIVALEMPPNMRMETVDYSFEHLCPLINKKVFRHPSQIKIVENAPQE